MHSFLQYVMLIIEIEQISTLAKIWRGVSIYCFIYFNLVFKKQSNNPQRCPSLVSQYRATTRLSFKHHIKRLSLYDVFLLLKVELNFANTMKLYPLREPFSR